MTSKTAFVSKDMVVLYRVETVRRDKNKGNTMQASAGAMSFTRVTEVLNDTQLFWPSFAHGAPLLVALLPD